MTIRGMAAKFEDKSDVGPSFHLESSALSRAVSNGFLRVFYACLLPFVVPFTRSLLRFRLS